MNETVTTEIYMTTNQLDRIDRNILSVLSLEGRLSMSELAAKVGLSKTPVQARVRRLEKDGLIRGYSALIDRERAKAMSLSFRSSLTTPARRRSTPSTAPFRPCARSNSAT